MLKQVLSSYVPNMQYNRHQILVRLIERVAYSKSTRAMNDIIQVYHHPRQHPKCTASSESFFFFHIITPLVHIWPLSLADSPQIGKHIVYLIFSLSIFQIVLVSRRRFYLATRFSFHLHFPFETFIASSCPPHVGFAPIFAFACY